jgi:hypothetical protein
MSGSDRVLFAQLQSKQPGLAKCKTNILRAIWYESKMLARENKLRANHTEPKY